MNNELWAAAQALGLALRQSVSVETYLAACADYEADTALVAQDKHARDVYQALIARQRAGEQLTEGEVKDYYALREQVQGDPLVMAREMALAGVKRLFADAGTVLTNQLGLDFTELALARQGE